MAEPFTEDWFADAALALGSVPGAGDASGTIHYIVEGVAGSKVHAQVVIDDGRVTEVASGKPTDPRCVVTVKADVALALLTGQVSTEVAFMQGRVKVEGDHAWWLLDLRALRAATADVASSLGEA